MYFNKWINKLIFESLSGLSQFSKNMGKILFNQGWLVLVGQAGQHQGLELGWYWSHSSFWPFPHYHASKQSSPDLLGPENSSVWCRHFLRQRTTSLMELKRLGCTGIFLQCHPTRGALAPGPSTKLRHPFWSWARLAFWKRSPIQSSGVSLDLPDQENPPAEPQFGL